MRNYKLFSMSVMLFVVLVNTCPLRGQGNCTVEEMNATERDTAVKIGKLPNGFTYYLRAIPSNIVEFRFSVKAGFNEETDEQTEIAHLTEHLAFRESKSFQDGIRNYLEKNGLKRGQDCGASTSYFSTTYFLRIPSKKKEMLPTGLQVVKDWANGVTFKQESIGSEVGAVSEEIRLGQSLSEFRLRNRFIYNVVPSAITRAIHGSDRSRLLQSFDRKELLEFYNDWYRPDLQALVVVGDFEMATMENDIKRIFSDLKKQPGAKKRVVPKQVILNGANDLKIITDSEKRDVELRVFYKQMKVDTSYNASIKLRILGELYNVMMKSRLDAYSRNANSPFRFIYSNFKENEFFYPLKLNALSISCGINSSNEVGPAFKTAMTELERAVRFGFSDNELQKAKVKVYSFYQSSENLTATDIASKYAAAFTNDELILSESYVWGLTRRIIQDASSKDINQFIKRHTVNKDRTVVILANDSVRTKLPDSDSINFWLDQVKNLNVVEKSYDLNVKRLLTEQEISKLDAGPFKMDTIGTIGLFHLTLSNGVNVYLRPVKHNNGDPYSGRIILHGVSRGGTSGYGDEDLLEASNAASIVSRSGFKHLSIAELYEIMSESEVMPYIAEGFEGILASGKVDQLHTILQLIYLYFKHPYITEEAFLNFKREKIDELRNKQLAIADIIDSVRNDERSKYQKLNVSRLEAISLKKCLDIYRERFSNASDFTFFLSGDFDPHDLIPLLNRYLGSLPSFKVVEEPITLSKNVPFLKESVRVTSNKGNVRNAKVELYFAGTYEYTPRNYILLSCIKETLNAVLFERLREKEKGVYYCNSNVILKSGTPGTYTFKIDFECTAENVDRLIQAALEEVSDLKTLGPRANVFQKVIESQRRTLDYGLYNPARWISYFVQQYEERRSFCEILKWSEILNSMSLLELKTGSKKWLREDLLSIFILQ